MSEQYLKSLTKAYGEGCKHGQWPDEYCPDCEVEKLEARVKELEAQRDELLSGIDKALTMYVTGQPMQFVADKLAEVYDKIEAEKAE